MLTNLINLYCAVSVMAGATNTAGLRHSFTDLPASRVLCES